MHIESNVCESVLATILGLDKSKDHAKARDDLQEIGIRPELHPIVDESGKRYYPPPCFVIKFETYAWLYMLQEASEKNKESRSHQPYTHRTGQRGFSIIHEMEVMFLNLDILLEVSN